MKKLTGTNICDECGIIRMPTIEIGEVNNLGSRTIILCLRCAIKAVKALEEENKHGR